MFSNCRSAFVGHKHRMPLKARLQRYGLSLGDTVLRHRDHMPLESKLWKDGFSLGGAIVGQRDQRPFSGGMVSHLEMPF